MIREIIKDILDELGYTTITCNDGEQAIDYYRKHHKEIELVIIDIVLPKINGYDCFLELKKINPHIKAIVSSGQATNDEVEKMILEGALGFIQKPFEINYLSKMINEALRN